MTTNEILRDYEAYVIGNYSKKELVLVRGEGAYAWDSEGRRYLDFFPGWGVNGLGHCHPSVTEAVRKQLGRLQHVANDYYNELQGQLARLLSARSFGGQCFFCNSGAEANEAAIKLARIATPPGRYRFITMHNSFHGRTMMTVSATAQPKYHRGFEPIVDAFTYVPYNDLKAVRDAIDERTCGVLVEPIQGEGGINVPGAGYLRGLRELCDGKNILLILDEVQTGVGRTGKFFAYQHFGIEPDVMTLAKTLGAGIPIGAMIARKEIAAALKPGTHASTFGGNPVACAAAIAVIETIEEERLLDNAHKMGEYLMNRLKTLSSRFSFVKDVRGKGLMVGLELTMPGKEIVRSCMQKGLLINCTHDVVVRMLPPLNVTKGLVDDAVGILMKALEENAP